MARDEAPPFARGETLFNNTAKDPVFADPDNYCGKEYVFEPNSPDGQNTGDITGRPIRVRIAKNVSGAALLPKRIARYKLINPLESYCDGYAFQNSDHIAGVIDEFLPPTGVANGDYFYLVVNGPTQVIATATSFAALAVGDRVEVAAGTSTLNADAGQIKAYVATGDNDITNFVGRVQDALAAAGTVNVVVHFPHG